MSESNLLEEPLQFGHGGRLFGILTLASKQHCAAPELPVFVFLNAGMLHRVGPYRLHVRLARDLSRMGFNSVRVDLADTGDSPRRPGLTYSQSVAADFSEITEVLESRLGRSPLILAGLCSGAHNAVRLAPEHAPIVGMVLLDPICFRDEGFATRAVVQKYMNSARWAAWFRRPFRALTISRGREQVRNDSVGSWISADKPSKDELRAAWGVPSLEQLRAAFQSIRERQGRVLSVFTGTALDYYNQAGQLGRVLGIEGYQQFCTEMFWPQAEHTFTLELHRRRLIDTIKIWAGGWSETRLH
jgi:Serine aminopeptidase, S33